MPTRIREAILCPACGAENSGDAIFCKMPECQKALGDFDFADEIVDSKSSRSEKFAEAVANFVGQFHFVTAHVLWFSVWILANSGILASMYVFDSYPYSLLGIILSIEAILITSFLLISNNRQNTFANKRAQLDYEVNIRTYRLLQDLLKSLDDLGTEVRELRKENP